MKILSTMLQKMKSIIIGIILPILTLQWWDVGHMLTAAIAQMRLNQLHPYASVHFRQLTLSINSLVDNKSQTFIQSACWADDIKSNKYSMNIWNAWHYTDKTYVTDGVFPVINFTEVAVNSISLLQHAIKTISSNMHKNTAERALFARFLVHVVGDMHQPLHSVALFNLTYPSGDRGGNSLKIILPNKRSQNFHSFWDAGGFLIQNDSWVMPRPLTQQNLTLLKEIASGMIKSYGNSIQKLALDTNPASWALQSFFVAQNTTYPPLFNSNQASQSYVEQTYQVSRKRITLAGYRLANLIIQIYQNSTKLEIHKEEHIWKKYQEYKIRQE